MSREGWYWLSTEEMTVAVYVGDDNKIWKFPPIVQKFWGQHINNLRYWMGKQPGFQQKVMR